MSQGDAAYLEFEDAPLYFECVPNEQADHASEVTEHAVEEGVNVTDHVRPTPDHVTLEVFVSNTPVRDVNGWYSEALSFESLPVDQQFPVTGGVELDVATFDKPLAPTPGALINSALDALSSLVDGKPKYKALVQTGIETKSVNYGAQVKTFEGAEHATRDVVAVLDDWRLRAVRGRVLLPWKTYENMVITKVSPRRSATTGDAAEISIELREVRVVSSETVAAPTEVRALPKKDMGRQPTTQVTPTKGMSVFKGLLSKRKK